MPRLRWNGDTLFSITGRSGIVSSGEEVEVDEDEAERLLDDRTGGWERVEPPEAADESADAEADAEADADTPESADASDGESGSADAQTFEVEAFLDRTPVSDVADDIEAGDADDHLDAVHEAADRKTVVQAVEARQSELEDEG